MGKKQQQGNNQDKRPEQNINEAEKQNGGQTKKKIIKKLIIKDTSKNDDTDLKNWKPTKIEKKVENNDDKKKKQEDIAKTFLSSLSKPINNSNENKNFFFDNQRPIRLQPKPANDLKKLTPEQIKWDIQDQTFIKKQFIPNRQIEHELEQGPIEDQDQIEPGEAKMKHIDLSKVINNDWKQTADKKMMKNQLWQGAQGVLEGRGTLARLAREAHERAQQIQSEINKRSYEKKQMKSRYGW